MEAPRDVWELILRRTDLHDLMIRLVCREWSDCVGTRHGITSEIIVEIMRHPQLMTLLTDTRHRYFCDRIAQFRAAEVALPEPPETLRDENGTCHKALWQVCAHGDDRVWARDVEPVKWFRDKRSALEYSVILSKYDFVLAYHVPESRAPFVLTDHSTITIPYGASTPSDRVPGYRRVELMSPAYPVISNVFNRLTIDSSTDEPLLIEFALLTSTERNRWMSILLGAASPIGPILIYAGWALELSTQ